MVILLTRNISHRTPQIHAMAYAKTSVMTTVISVINQ